MKFAKLTFVFFAAALFTAACTAVNTNSNSPTASTTNTAVNQAATTPTAMPDELASAREIYSQRCVNCHSENGEGGRKEVDGEKIKVPNLKDPRVAAEPDDDYIGQIEGGGDGMPAYKGKISDEDIKNLVRLIRRDFQGKK